MTYSRRAGDGSGARAVVQFVVTSAVAMLLLAAGGAYVLSRIGRSEAVADARDLTALAARAVVEPALTDEVVRGDPSALARLDGVVRRRLLRHPVVRVKLWTLDGHVVYSDVRALIGSRYALGSDERAAIRNNRVDAEVSDLGRPENRFERRYSKLLEVYLPVRTRAGRQLLFEQYLRYESIVTNSHKIFRSFLPALLGSLLLLELAQVPLARSLVLRLREGQRERERLLQQAVEASETERRRIAADLHDGLVQDLAGLSFELAADAERCSQDGDAAARAALANGAAAIRHSVRQLRALLVRIYPPSLRRAGLVPALSDLLAAAAARGLETELDADEHLSLPVDVEHLLYRAAQESVRNVVAHAGASRVAVRLRRDDGMARLVVRDDGAGFAAADAIDSGGGHLGLSLLHDLAADAGGKLVIESRPGAGTTLTLEVPAS